MYKDAINNIKRIKLNIKRFDFIKKYNKYNNLYNFQVNTYYINKSNNNELLKAINSIFY
jgi:hypothetical protein